MRVLIIGTKNTGKVWEFEQAMRGISGWILESLPADAPDVDETGTTFVDNAILKAIAYSHLSEHLTVADDSGLMVDALNGRPGIHSARYAPDAASRIARVLEELHGVDENRRTAQFSCALSVAAGGHLLWTTERVVHGRIAHTPRGQEGFGYDPVFLLPELGRTMAEMDTDAKNRLSARGQAIADLKEFLKGR